MSKLNRDKTSIALSINQVIVIILIYLLTLVISNLYDWNRTYNRTVSIPTEVEIVRAAQTHHSTLLLTFAVPLLLLFLPFSSGINKVKAGFSGSFEFALFILWLLLFFVPSHIFDIATKTVPPVFDNFFGVRFLFPLMLLYFSRLAKLVGGLQKRHLSKMNIILLVFLIFVISGLIELQVYSE